MDNVSPHLPKEDMGDSKRRNTIKNIESEAIKPARIQNKKASINTIYRKPEGSSSSLLEGFRGEENGLVRRGARQTPPPGERPIKVNEERKNPFRKAGLRRSPQIEPVAKTNETHNQPATAFPHRSLRSSSVRDIPLEFQTHTPPESQDIGKAEGNYHQIYAESIPGQDSDDSDRLFVGSPIRLRDLVGLEMHGSPLNPQVEYFENVTHSPTTETPEFPSITIIGSNSPRSSSRAPEPASTSEKTVLISSIYQQPHSNRLENKIHPLAESRDDSLTSPKSLQEPSKRIHGSSPELMQKQIPPIQSKRQRIADQSATSVGYEQKKAKRDSLLQEIERLRADLRIASAENERMCLRPTSSSSKLEFSQETLTMLLRATSVVKEPNRCEERECIFQNLDAFLPFNSRRFRRRGTKQIKVAYIEKMPSHFPQLVENQLPFLQAFTPLAWTSKISLFHPKLAQGESEAEAEIELLQKQVITASHPRGLFFARVVVIFDAISQAVTELSLLYLPACAENELGNFIRNVLPTIKEPENPNSNREMGVICYAIGRWVEVSLRRAKFWWLVKKRYSTSKARRNTLPPITLHSTKKKRNETGHGNDERVCDKEESGYDALSDDSSDEAGIGISGLSGKQLLPHFGRSTFCIKNDDNVAQEEGDKPAQNIELLFEWRLSFDWTGEVKSHISASPIVPKKWKESDPHNGLDGIPHIFHAILRESGPLAAVAGIVKIVFGDM